MEGDYNRGSMPRRAAVLLTILLTATGCGRGDTPAAPQPWILLVTLDTTRADALTPEVAPAYAAMAAAGRRFTLAQATVPETLPAHASIMTGLYPGGHGVHENGRFLAATHPVLAEELGKVGYRTVAVVSAYVLAKRFGLARGFEVYDDGLPEGGVERSAEATTTLALTHLGTLGADRPAFVWAHYFDAHAPYAPPPPFRDRFADRPYIGEVAYADAQMARLVDAFRDAARAAGREAAIIVTADHGEGLGDHGEAQHGNLVYQSTMHVPLVVSGPGVAPGEVTTPVSIRRIFHTVLDWAGRPSLESLRAPEISSEVILGEAMKPYLQYGWQPQIMAVAGTTKAIVAGRTEVYDLAADPRELKDLKTGASLPAPLRSALDDYPVPSLTAAPSASPMDAEAKEKLASLGYVSATTTPSVRRDAPRPVDMAHLFPVLDQASTLFVQGRYREVIPVLRRILAADPNHLDATLRLATAHSRLGERSAAQEMFVKAAALAPESWDVKLYYALHLADSPRWKEAVPVLEAIVAREPNRVAAVEGLARLRMQMQDTPGATRLFEQLRTLQGAEFGHALELGVLYQAAGRFADAARQLDAVAPSHPGYPMALFKRAQVSVLLNEPDRAARIAAARRHADATTRVLIERERLFR